MEITLTVQQLEKALECLYKELPPPPELRQLSFLEWESLSLLLEDLLKSRQGATLH